MPRIFGDRIMLREYKKEDLPFIRRWVNNPEIVDNLSDIFVYPQTLEQSEAFLQSRLENNDKDVHFIIADKNTEEYIGQIDLLKVDTKNRVAVLGIVIGNEEYLGKKYGREAINLILNFAFNRLNLHKIELSVYDYNIRAQKCYLSCGFKEEGRLRKHFYINGEYKDKILMGILKEEFENMNKQ